MPAHDISYRMQVACVRGDFDLFKRIITEHGKEMLERIDCFGRTP